MCCLHSFQLNFTQYLRFYENQLCKLNEYQHSLYIIYNIARSIDVVVDAVENRGNTTLNMTFSSCFYYDSLYSIKPASRVF